MEHLSPGKVLAEHFRRKKTSYRTLKSKNHAFFYEFQSFKKFDGTLVVRLQNTSVRRNSGWEPLLYFVSYNFSKILFSHFCRPSLSLKRSLRTQGRRLPPSRGRHQREFIFLTILLISVLIRLKITAVLIIPKSQKKLSSNMGK